MSTATSDNQLLRVYQIDGTLVLTPSADLREFEFDQIEAAADVTLRRVDSGEIKNVVIDFRETDFYGSTALAFFVKLWKRVKSAGGRLAFCNVSAHEREILEITHLNTLWPLCESLPDALAVVARRGEP
ncbi:MAG: STAS domain-containing protein [Pirellulaceae bacterium]